MKKNVKKVAVVCGAIGAFGLGWVLCDKYLYACISSGLMACVAEGSMKFGETIDGVFRECTPEEWVKIMRARY